MEDTGGKSGRRPARHLQVAASGLGNAASVQPRFVVVQIRRRRRCVRGARPVPHTEAHLLGEPDRATRPAKRVSCQVSPAQGRFHCRPAAQNRKTQNGLFACREIDGCKRPTAQPLCLFVCATTIWLDSGAEEEQGGKEGPANKQNVGLAACRAADDWSVPPLRSAVMIVMDSPLFFSC